MGCKFLFRKGKKNWKKKEKEKVSGVIQNTSPGSSLAVRKDTRNTAVSEFGKQKWS